MISNPRLAITSLAFMLVEVPAPPWNMSTTKLVVKLSGQQFVAGLADGLHLLLVHDAQGSWPGRRLF
jgi:hypothetical protein